jgi:TRAP-type C4-dicarboxylate transport system substrate-binding protein
MKKRILFIALAVVLALSVGIIGCNGGQQEEEEEEEEEEPGVIELKCAHTVPPVEASAGAWIEWGDMIEEEWAAIKGDDEPGLEFTYYWSMSLLMAHEMYDGVEAGTADIGFYPIGVNPGLLPMNEVARLCFLFSSMDEALCVGAEMYEGEETLFVDEIEGDGAVKFLTWYMMGPYQLHMATDDVTLPADLAGRPIGAEGEILDIITAAGGTAVETTFADVAQSLDLGTIEGNILHMPAQFACGGLDFTTSHTNFGTAGVATVPAVFIMNPDSWDSLPSALQDLIVSKLPEFAAGQQGALFGSAAYFTGIAVDRGDTFIDLTASQIDEWRALAVEQHNNWKAQSTAHDDAYNLVQSFIANCQ